MCEDQFRVYPMPGKSTGGSRHEEKIFIKERREDYTQQPRAFTGLAK